MDEININDNGTTGMGLDYIMIPSNLPMYDVYQTILSNSDITDTEKEDILQIYKQKPPPTTFPSISFLLFYIILFFLNIHN
jgi:hypothetical protein